MAILLHLVPESVWHGLPASATTYAPASLAAEGFVHCTAGDDLMLQVANAFYRGEPGEVLVLSLDEAALTAPVRWEPGVPAPLAGSEAVLFPHVFGPLDRAAVVAVRRVTRSAD